MIQNNFSIAVAAENSALEAKAVHLANTLDLALAPPNSKAYHYLLLVTPSRLILKTTQNKNNQSVYVDFLSAKHKYRQKNHQRELLIKALGRPDPSGLIVDATAGFGEDAFILASKGRPVIMLERSPIFAALLSDGLARFYGSSEDSSHISLELIHQDAKIYLPQLAKEKAIAVAYLDPMFPERKKAALSRKEMEILRTLVGGDMDADELLRISLKTVTHRVVVKRPRLAGPLADLKPTFSFTGKISRFDVYVV